MRPRLGSCSIDPTPGLWVEYESCTAGTYSCARGYGTGGYFILGHGGALEGEGGGKRQFQVESTRVSTPSGAISSRQRLKMQCVSISAGCECSSMGWERDAQPNSTMVRRIAVRINLLPRPIAPAVLRAGYPSALQPCLFPRFPLANSAAPSEASWSPSKADNPSVRKRSRKAASQARDDSRPRNSARTRTHRHEKVGLVTRRALGSSLGLPEPSTLASLRSGGSLPREPPLLTPD